MYHFLPLLGYGLDGEELPDGQVLEHLQRQVWRQVADDVERRLRILLQEEDLETDVSRHAGV